jgi:hypothetical protein
MALSSLYPQQLKSLNSPFELDGCDFALSRAETERADTFLALVCRFSSIFGWPDFTVFMAFAIV